MMTHTIPDAVRRRRFDVHELQRMAEAGLFGDDERLELIDGELIEMPRYPKPPHAGRVDRLTRLFVERCERRCAVRVQGPLLLDDYNLVLPDVTLLRPAPDFYESRHPGPADVLLVVEVADTTLERDRGPKRALYARMRIPRLWIVDVLHACVHVCEEPDGERYTRERRAEGDDLLAVPENGVVAARTVA